MKKFNLLFILTLILFCSGDALWAETESEKLQREARENEENIRDAQKSLREIENELRRLRKESQSNQNRLNTAKLELQKAVQELRIQQGKVNDVKKEVGKIEGSIISASNKIERQREIMARRAANLLKLSRLEKMEFLLQAKDAVDIEMRSKLLAVAASADIALIRKTIDIRAQMELMKFEKEKALQLLIEEERKLAAAKNNVDSRKRVLERLQAKLEAETADKKAAKEKTLAMINRIKNQLSSIRTRLKEISRRRIVPTRFVAPTDGRYFKPEGITLPGVYVKANPGTKVKVIADGEVVSIVNYHGLGQTVIVGHGGDLTSVYANLQSVNVSVGDNLSRGNQIANSGVSPYGNAYYFAVYKDGFPQNPGIYLR